MIFREFREKYPSFIYESFKVELIKHDLKISFSFKIEPDIRFFPEVWIREVPKSASSSSNKSVINNLAFHLGLMEIPSYWKATCSPKIAIKAGNLTQSQRKWWHDLLIRGMGQFFYENKIDFKEKQFVSIVSQDKGGLKLHRASVKGDKTLIPVGGGKDSVVTLATLMTKAKVGAFILNSTPASDRILRLAKPREIIRVDRSIDKKLLQLNAEGFLNGHTPFSAYLAFLSILVAYIFAYKNIAFSNESSADEGNVKYLGYEINHQYTKSFDFEKKFRDYNRRYLSNINYFSFLRPLSEIQISKIFSKMNNYFSSIRSCNVGQKTDSWCSRCPKCLSTFILLYPFLGPKRILKIFPKNLYEDENLFQLLVNLVSEDKIKPFECVGTREELKSALFLSLNYYRKGEAPELLSRARKQLLVNEKGLEQKASRLFNSWNSRSFLAKDLELILKRMIHE